MSRKVDLSLYLVADEIHFRKGVIEDEIVKAVEGGIKIVQLREKKCSVDEFKSLARRVIDALRRYQVPIIINDRVDVADSVRAHGVHLGQSDLDPSIARQILGENAIIGLSIENEMELTNPNVQFVNYIGVSSVFPTHTKGDIRRVWGLAGIRKLRQLTPIPLVGIGGIHEGNLQEVIRAGADGVAILSAFKAREDWRAKAEALSKLIHQEKQGHVSRFDNCRI